MSTLQTETARSRNSVPDGVRLHMFDCGTLKCHLENIKMNQGVGDEYESPSPGT